MEGYHCFSEVLLLKLEIQQVHYVLYSQYKTHRTFYVYYGMCLYNICGIFEKSCLGI